MDRKQFIKTCGFACLGGTALATLLQSCGSANYFAQTTLAGNLLSVKKAGFVVTAKSKPAFRKFVLVKTGGFDFPICLFRIADDRFNALLMRCTHRGCELQAQGSYLACPCHGSEFDNAGKVQHPPAERDLQTFQTTTDHENIYIHL